MELSWGIYWGIKMTEKEYNGFEELKFYIMRSIDEIKEEVKTMKQQIQEWREDTLLDIVDIKAKIKTTASISAFVISLIVSVTGVIMALILK